MSNYNRILNFYLTTTITYLSFTSVMTWGYPKELYVGVIIPPNHKEMERAAKFSENFIKNQIQPISNYSRTSPNITFVIEHVPFYDSFKAHRKTCALLNYRVITIICGVHGAAALQVQSICRALDIPFLAISRLLNAYQMFSSAQLANQIPVQSKKKISPLLPSITSSINFYPHYSILSNALLAIIKQFQWKDVTLIYDDASGLIRMADMLSKNSKLDIDIRLLRSTIPSATQYDVEKFEQMKATEWHPLLKDLKKRVKSRFIIDCNLDNTFRFMQQALMMDMIDSYHHYIITNLDFTTLKWDGFSDKGSNITGFRLRQDRSSVEKWHMAEMAETIDKINLLDSRVERKKYSEFSLKIENALLLDVSIFLLKSIEKMGRTTYIQPSSVKCALEQPWKQGETLINVMSVTKFDGIFSGARKYREAVVLEIYEVHHKQFRAVGIFEKNALIANRSYEEDLALTKQTLKNKTLIVSVKLTEPYVMLKNNSEKYSGNERFEGFCVDLLSNIRTLMVNDGINFNYKLKLVSDNTHGQPLKTNPKIWNGMINELMTQKADLAISDLTITFAREQVVDFTKPFLNLGIGILFKKPQKKTPNLFSFFSPLSIDIWLYVIAAYLGVSFMLFVVARFSPYEWYNSHPCSPESDVAHNQFTVMNSLWFNLGSLMQQGSEISPRALSTRLLSGFWWFFTLIIISSYTANLAAFLTVQRMVSPIQNADDLSKQTEIKYGSLSGGSSESFFMESKIPTYERMWNFMDSNRDVFTKSNEEGFRRVKEGNYAYLMESTTIEYMTQRDCELTQVGGLLTSKGYGIGSPTGSPYRDLLSDRILQMQESGDIQALYNLWWKKKRGGGRCETNVDSGQSEKTNELGLANVGGVFVILIAGVCLSIMVAVFEFMWKLKQLANREGKTKSVIQQIHDSLHFAICCGGPKKYVEEQQSTEKAFDPHNDDSENLLNHEKNTDISNSENEMDVIKRRTAYRINSIRHNPSKYQKENQQYQQASTLKSTVLTSSTDSSAVSSSSLSIIRTRKDFRKKSKNRLSKSQDSEIIKIKKNFTNTIADQWRDVATIQPQKSTVSSHQSFSIGRNQQHISTTHSPVRSQSNLNKNYFQTSSDISIEPPTSSKGKKGDKKFETNTNVPDQLIQIIPNYHTKQMKLGETTNKYLQRKEKRSKK
ncbi:hypothetical protein SNEBB_005673 [Seison nebaliae]|nr:hypothetical protein SNEBB_005673 [Seison nebaliae]